MIWKTVGETIFENGNRHVRRGLQHYAEGRPEFAQGSFTKALRNYERALKTTVAFADDTVVLGIVRMKAQQLLRTQVTRLRDEEPRQRERI